MSVRFKDKLSYAWGLVANRGEIYSRVIEENFIAGHAYCNRLYGGVFAGPLYTQVVPFDYYANRSEWLVAQPIKGDSDNFRMYLHTYDHITNDADTGLASRISDFKKFNKTALSGVYTKDQAISYIKDWEAGKLPAQVQPFSKRLASKLASPKNS
jgi:hypothetical protein